MSSIGEAESGGGTVVKLPPGPMADSPITTKITSASQDDRVSINVANRKAKMDERKRELLLEARSARVEWIHEDNISANEDDDDEIFNVGNNTSNTNLLNELQACTTDVLPCAPQIIESMLSSNCEWRRQYNKNITSQTNGTLRQILEKQNLSWKLVSQKSSLKDKEGGELKHDDDAAVKNSSLDLPSVPSAQYYATFLNTLCEPSAANVVISIQQFIKTIQTAADVMVASMQEDVDNSSGGGTKESERKVANNGDDVPAHTPAQDHHNHGTSLAKAVRGFINKTVRELEEHEAFHDYLYPQKQSPIAGDNGDNKATIDAAAREELLASLEKFVYSKCRRDIDKVLLTACEEIKDAKSMKTLEVELHDKMLSLQFVTPAHLEIQCLKSKSTSDTVDSHESIDLSYTIQQIQSIHGLSSPRQMLQSILLAHRGVSVALNEACGQETTGADDVLPTLILATLRAHPPHLLSSLRFIEDFAPISLLRGEAGYAYTNLCGAMQFIRELDMDGHLAEVISLEGTGEKSAVLSIGPEEFRLGLEMCRRKMKAKMEEKEQLKLGSVEECMNNDYHGGYDANNEQCINGTSFQINITAHDVRDARTRGETIDLDWAMRKQSKSALLQRNATDASSDTIKYNQQLNLPPEEPPLPSHFLRSYSYLTSNPDSIGIRDLPKLLKEYKMLVHVTEKLLNERSVWRESERKRQTKLERQQLEKDFLDVGIDEDGNSPKLANGH